MRRSVRLTLAALACLGLAAYNLVGVVSGVQRYTVLAALPLSVPPAYLLISSAVWGVGFALAGWGLWRRRRWARGLAFGALALYLAQGWFDRLVLARTDFARTSAPYHLALHLLALALLAWALWGPPRRSFTPGK
jgi:hypothetical protein